MSNVHLPRVLLGGLIAGLVMNVGEAALHAGLLGRDTEALYKTLNVLPPNPAQTLPLLIALAFVMGIVSIWLYAAIYSLDGSRGRSVVMTGVVVWFLAHAWSGVYMAAGYAGVFTARLAWIPVLWGLLEATLAVLAGSFVYKPYAR